MVTLDPSYNFTLPSTPIPSARPTDLMLSSTEGDSTSEEDYPAALTSIAVAAVDYSNKGRFHEQQFEFRNDSQSNVALSAPSDNQCSSTGAQKSQGSSQMAIMPPELTAVTTVLPGSNEASELGRPRREPLEDPKCDSDALIAEISPSYREMILGTDTQEASLARQTPRQTEHLRVYQTEKR